MSIENPTDFTSQEPHLTLIHSVETPEEASPILRQFIDTSLSTEEIASHVENLLQNRIRPEDLRRAEDTFEHPQLIIRTLLDEFNYVPDLDEMRKSSLRDGGSLGETEKAVLQEALIIEKLFSKSIKRLEDEAEAKTLHGFVETIDEYTNEHHADTTIMRAVNALAERMTGRNDRLRATMVITRRIVYTMLYLQDEANQS